MISTIVAFFTGTKLGRSIGLAVLLALACFATYKVVHHRAFKEGQAATQAKWDSAVATARSEASKAAATNDRTSAGIAAQARTGASTASAAVDKTVTQSKEVIRYVYKNPPVGAPVRPGSCVFALDDRVQKRIQLGLDQAAAAAR